LVATIWRLLLVLIGVLAQPQALPFSVKADGGVSLPAHVVAVHGRKFVPDAA
jgi:hypothetical protein